MQQPGTSPGLLGTTVCSTSGPTALPIGAEATARRNSSKGFSGLSVEPHEAKGWREWPGTIRGSDTALLRVIGSSPTLSITSSVKDLSFRCHKYRSGMAHVHRDEWMLVTCSEAVSTVTL